MCVHLSGTLEQLAHTLRKFLFWFSILYSHGYNFFKNDKCLKIFQEDFLYYFAFDHNICLFNQIIILLLCIVHLSLIQYNTIGQDMHIYRIVKMTEKDGNN
jgi:hypothetical protein